MEITVNDPTKDDKRLRFYRSCVSGEWNTYSVIVRQVPESPTTLRYVLRIDAVEVANGTYDVSQAYAIGDLYAMVSNNYDATSAQNEVRNFYFQRFEDRNIFQMANIAWIEKSMYDKGKRFFSIDLDDNYEDFSIRKEDKVIQHSLLLKINFYSVAIHS